MSKKHGLMLCLIILVVALSAAMAYGVAPVDSIMSGEIVGDDLYTVGKTIRNDGRIKGDFISFGQKVISTGTVEGDFISGAGDIDITGRAMGDVRVAAGNIVLDGIVEKNTNVFGGNIDIRNNALMNRNLIAAGGSLDIDGIVKGNSRIYGEMIILRGEFLGNVDVYIDPSKGKSKGELVVSPGTVIHGELRYKGPNEAVIENGASIGSFKWEKSEVRTKDNTNSLTNNIWKFIKLMLSTLIYFLIAMLFYKLFPKLFVKQAEFIEKKPLNVLGAGLIALIAIIVSALVFGILLFFSVVLISPAISVVFAAVTLLIYIILFYFSTVPVSMWLGRAIFKDERYSDMFRFGGGLLIITTILFILDILEKLPGAGFIFGLINFAGGFAVLLLGAGTLLYIAGEFFRAARMENRAAGD